jgi:hypothetical protein
MSEYYRPETTIGEQVKIRSIAGKTGRWPFRVKKSSIRDYFNTLVMRKANMAEQEYLNSHDYFERMQILAAKGLIECQTGFVWGTRAVINYLTKKGRILK